MSDFAIFCAGLACGAIITLVVVLIAQDAKRARDLAAEDAIREEAEREALERAEEKRVADVVIQSLSDQERGDILTGKRKLSDVVRARATTVKLGS